jgi:chromate reductase, NAD(P)H dehydrogenase (quinone)
MNTPLRILGICGSLRTNSFNRSALRAAQELAPEGTEVETFDLREIPIFQPDEEATPPPIVVEFKARIRAADAILFVSPEYNYSIPGVLKNAIDWATRPFGQSAWQGKPAGIMGASPGNFGTVRMQLQLRPIFVFLNMYPLNQPEVLITGAAQKFDAVGRLTDQPTRDVIRKYVEALALWTRRLEYGRGA